MSDQQLRFGTFVCGSCLEDEALQKFANTSGEGCRCDYCGTNVATRKTVLVDKLVDFMAEAISCEWCDPVQTSPVDGGSYLVETIDSWELFDLIGFQVSNERLMEDLLKAFADHQWCAANWQLLSPSRRWHYGWNRFQHVVKHQRRYTFWYSRDDLEDVSHPDCLPPADMLAEVDSVIGNVKLIKVLPIGTSIWRARIHSVDEIFETPDRFTPPPLHLANQPNRMSPAGVPMFYGADDFDTALIELLDPTNGKTKSKASGAQFRNVVPLNLLDLTSIPSPPSYFAPGGPVRRHAIQFLSRFAKDLSQPIEKDGRQHIEYVPTQVFTEFVRFLMKTPEGGPVDGIRYSSSKNGRPCSVIFATQEECLPDGPLAMVTQRLEFVPGSTKSVTI